MKKQFYFIAVILGLSFTSKAQTSLKILFDASKAQMCTNADWVIDADVFNIGTGTGGIMQTGKGNEANPQRIPTPAQSGITSTTAETYWKGALSAWAVEMVKKGFIVETLPYQGSLTYGNTSNVQDLSNYKVLVIDEPNISFTTAEKNAILSFVQNGGGLFMISDHTNSDRNNDSWDSPAIWNDLMNNNGTVTNPFGINFDLQNFSQTTSNFASISTDPVLHGVGGNPTQMKFSNGTSMTLNKTANSTVVGVVYKTGSSTTGTTGVMMAHAHYGSGKVAAIGDSSPSDDGTGDTNDALYNGWTGDVAGDHKRIFINATIWLSNNVYRISDETSSNQGIYIWPNPNSGNFQFSLNNIQSNIVEVSITDIQGRIVFAENNVDATSTNAINLQVDFLNSGMYLLNVKTENHIYTERFIKN